MCPPRQAHKPDEHRRPGDPPIGVTVQPAALHKRGHGALGDPEHRCGHAVGDGLGVVGAEVLGARPPHLGPPPVMWGPSAGRRHVSTSITRLARSSSSGEPSWAARMSARASSLASSMSGRSRPSRLAVGSTRHRCSSSASWARRAVLTPLSPHARPHRRTSAQHQPALARLQLPRSSNGAPGPGQRARCRARRRC